MDVWEKQRKMIIRIMNIDNNDNDNDDQQQQQQEIDYITTKIPTIILLDIINRIEDNVDLISCLLTCKKLYEKIRLQYSHSIRFKGLQYIGKRKDYTSSDDDHSLDYFTPLVYKMGRCMPSFRGILQNTLSNQLVIAKKSPELLNAVSDISKRLNNFYVIDGVLHDDESTNGQSSQQSMSFNFDNQQQYNNQVSKVLLVSRYDPLDYITLPSSTRQLIIEQSNGDLSTFKNLESFIPSTVEHLEIDCECLDLSSTSNQVIPNTIKSLVIHLDDSIDQIGDYENEICLPSGLESLTLRFGRTIPFNQLPFNHLLSLTTLEFTSKTVTTGVLPTSLTSLKINLENPPPTDFFKPLPNLVTLHVQIFFIRRDSFIMDLESLQYLESLKFSTSQKVDINLPVSESLICLSLPFNSTKISHLPKSLEICDISYERLMALVQTTPLPTSLHKLQIQNCPHGVPVGVIPNSVKVLSFASISTALIVEGSIPSSVEKLGLGRYNGPTSPSFLPDSIKHLTWRRGIARTESLPKNLETLTWKPLMILSFGAPDKLDDIINHTKVQELNLTLSSSSQVWVQLAIQRLDNDNSNVMMVDNQSIFGGFFKQKRMEDGKYGPLYLVYHKDGKESTYFSYEIPTTKINKE
ncbi:hypothetical protein DFA_00655 [Cavenderia fasciculata]|uniref:Uncharacterized protein n=1 Tax=Cavenderia fasciculata TaxID=261658 RepID=F4PT01_CACFS|nr:uncharacterized protein DFA_00655 [Cavenderia fasciculata]EGG20790.1 hypothetical protein DFA_00655 [Cavenderia fasciculata]|eukprot:XP_004358640.1 hypothetical protein DFA_00655 [Cavenderia fasciculata]